MLWWNVQREKKEICVHQTMEPQTIGKEKMQMYLNHNWEKEIYTHTHTISIAWDWNVSVWKGKVNVFIENIPKEGSERIKEQEKKRIIDMYYMVRVWDGIQVKNTTEEKWYIQVVGMFYSKRNEHTFNSNGDEQIIGFCKAITTSSKNQSNSLYWL